MNDFTANGGGSLLLQCQVRELRPRQLPKQFLLQRLDLEFGRIVASGTEAPILLADLV